MFGCRQFGSWSFRARHFAAVGGRQDELYRARVGALVVAGYGAAAGRGYGSKAVQGFGVEIAR